MKATLTIIVSVVLALNMNLLFAGTKSTSVPVTNESGSMIRISISSTSLVGTPFNDASMEMKSLIDLAPTTPAVADFEDAVDSTTFVKGILAPSTPAEANFE